MRPGGLAGLSRGRPLCGGCVWNCRCCFPSRHNTRGCCGETGLSTLLARCQEARSAPCLCASKFHCLQTDTPRSAEPPRGFSRAGEWGPESGGTPAPLFSVGARGGPARGALSEIWAPGLSTRSRQGPGKTFPGMGRFHPRRNATLDPRSPPGGRSLWNVKIFQNS